MSSLHRSPRLTPDFFENGKLAMSSFRGRGQGQRKIKIGRQPTSESKLQKISNTNTKRKERNLNS